MEVMYREDHLHLVCKFRNKILCIKERRSNLMLLLFLKLTIILRHNLKISKESIPRSVQLKLPTLQLITQ